MSFGIENRKNAGKIAQWQVFEKGGGKCNQGNHAQGHEGGAEEFVHLRFFGKSRDFGEFVLCDEGDEYRGDGHECQKLKEIAPAQHVDANGGAGRVVEQLRGLFWC